MSNHICLLMLICLVGTESSNIQIQPKEIPKQIENKLNDPELPLPPKVILDSATKGSVKKEMHKTVVSSQTDKKDNGIDNTVKPSIPQDKAEIKPSEDSPQIESGAVIRGVIIFVGISMIFILYLGFKTYRKKKSNIIVRKYGVRTRRSDVEMRPLPLDDEEEDETVFDIGNLNRS